MMTASADTNKSPGLWPWLAIAGLVIALDQLTKILVVQHLQLGDAEAWTSFFNLVRAHNAGAAFSFLASESGWQRWFFTAIGLSATGLILWQLRQHRGQRLISLAMALILGGALGNVIDRVIHGHVIDFLDFHWTWLSGLFPGGHFPAFNVADSAITLGAACLIVHELLRMKQKPADGGQQA